ncbi:MAG: hypothetical protein ACM3IJ_01745 [Candidatus Levyibacteriota bacterium]
MEFTTEQKNYWRKMAGLTNEYLNDRIDLELLVAGLNELFGNMHIADKEIQKEWYDRWIPLQIFTQETEEKVPREVRKMTVSQIKEYLESKAG